MFEGVGEFLKLWKWGADRGLIDPVPPKNWWSYLVV